VHSDAKDVGKYGVAIDTTLVSDIDGRAFMTLDTNHYQVTKLFGIEKQDGDANSNKWLHHLQKLREDATTIELNKAYTTLDSDCSNAWHRRSTAKKDLFDRIPKVVDVSVFHDEAGDIKMAVATEAHHRGMLKFEATAENLTYLNNAFYYPPPHEVRFVKRQKHAGALLPAYPEYPDVKVKNTRGTKTVYIPPMVTASGKRHLSKVVPPTMTLEAELIVVSRLQAAYTSSRLGRAGDGDAESLAGDSVTDDNESIADDNEEDDLPVSTSCATSSGTAQPPVLTMLGVAPSNGGGV
jgi:hypothetical protein